MKNPKNNLTVIFEELLWLVVSKAFVFGVAITLLLSSPFVHPFYVSIIFLMISSFMLFQLYLELRK